MENEYKAEKSAYGKRPLWQWAVIYLIIGGVIYTAIYFVFLTKKSGPGNNNPSQNGQQKTQFGY